MSRFVASGQSNLQTQEAIERETSLQIRQEEAEKEIPSLYEQMRLNHERKEFEFQAKMKKKNESFKIGEKELKFYEKIKEEKEQKEKREKMLMENGLKTFEERKKQAQSKESSSFSPTPPVIQSLSSTIIKSNLKPTLNKKTSLGIKKKTTGKPTTSLDEGKIKEVLEKQEEKNQKDKEPKSSLMGLNDYSSSSDSE